MRGHDGDGEDQALAARVRARLADGGASVDFDEFVRDVLGIDVGGEAPGEG